MTISPPPHADGSVSSHPTDAPSGIRDGAAGPDSPKRHLGRDVRSSILIGLCCFIIYNANLRAISAGDAYPARYLPFAVWKYQTVLVDPIEEITSQGRAHHAYWIVRLDDGRNISLYPVTLPLLIAPLYLPAVAYVHSQNWTISAFDRAARVMEKVSASLIASISSALLYLLLRRRSQRGTALLLSIAYAFGTTTWMIGSQALWQHGMAQLLITCALLLLTGFASTRSVIGAGLTLGLIAANRPPDAIIAATLGVYALVWAGRRVPVLIGAAAIPLALLLFYNIGVAGHIAGGYGIVGRAQFLNHELLPGLAGLLFSPTRGLFVFSPFLLFLVPAWRPPVDRNERFLTLAAAAAVVLQLMLYAKSDWRAGMAFGPRFLTDMLPLLFWMLAPAAALLRGIAKAGLIVAIAFSICVQAIGAWCYTPVTDAPIFAVRSGPDVMRAAWNWRNAPFVSGVTRGLAPPELTMHVRGKLDDLHVGARSKSSVTPGEPLFASGWALVDDGTPLQAGIMIDGVQGAASRTFFDRPDVRSHLGVSSPAGWTVPIDTAHLSPGAHRIAAHAWNSEKGDVYYLGERTLVVRHEGPHGSGQRESETAVPAELAEDTLGKAFEMAADRIRERQQPDGSWLTAFTSSTRFEKPGSEMNTFLTSFMVELLDPIEGAARMEGALGRAREHLTAQIEPGGLVRYHGLPDGPGIGTLGCAITPDTDDTALVWKIAPPADRRELAAALRTISRYRTDEGLYRTWLAPREAYQCLDPGKDPNPPDIVIQMNLLLLLAQEDPEAGRALCKAIREVAGENRVWVYYARSPLIAMLRLPSLARAGCAIDLPQSRMATASAEQQIWVSAIMLLNDAQTSSASVDEDELRRVLHRLSLDDFAMLKTNPPLLYHNDLTASVSRYYWSEDFGYALWLRLAHIHDRIERTRDSS